MNEKKIIIQDNGSTPDMSEILKETLKFCTDKYTFVVVPSLIIYF